MHVVEKSSEGLSRVLEVTVPMSDLNSRLEAKIKEIGPQLKLKGFRPGKVPPAHVRKVFGRELMGEILQDTLNTTPQQALDQANIRPAAPADLTPTSDMEKVVKGEADLSYQMEVEIMPDFEPVDATSLELSRPVYEASDEDIGSALTELLAQSKSYEAKSGKNAVAADGDMVVMDFVGRMDGKEFDGGSANDAEIVLGSGQFIPGFEEQLIGAKAGDSRTVTVNFPADYPVANLAGAPAEFEVAIKEVKAAQDAKADDAFAERLGMENLKALKDVLKTQLDQQYLGQSRFRLKRHLLDALDTSHAFSLPAKMVEQEFETIWKTVEADRQNGQLPPEDEGKSDAELRGEYRVIAERRVRLGLVLAEMGRRAGVTVTDQELSNAVMNEARQYPGQEKQVFDFYRQNPNAAAQLRAPIFEEKVCDWLFSTAKVTDEKVSKEALFDNDADEAPKAKPAKKAVAKKADKAEAAPAKAEPAAEKPAKKAAAKAEPKTEAKADAPAKKSAKDSGTKKAK
jgi:trigger factor